MYIIYNLKKKCKSAGNTTDIRAVKRPTAVVMYVDRGEKLLTLFF